MVYHSKDKQRRRRPAPRFGWVQPVGLVVNIARVIIDLVRLLLGEMRSDRRPRDCAPTQAGQTQCSGDTTRPVDPALATSAELATVAQTVSGRVF